MRYLYNLDLLDIKQSHKNLNKNNVKNLIRFINQRRIEC